MSDSTVKREPLRSTGNVMTNPPVKQDDVKVSYCLKKNWRGKSFFKIYFFLNRKRFILNCQREIPRIAGH